MAKPMSSETIARLMSRRSLGAYLQQRRNERVARDARLGVACALVLAKRAANGDWAWLDQDRALHQP